MSDGVQATGGQDGHTHESACLNCGTALVGPHCHACGQQAHLHRTAGAFLHDLLHGALHFEGRTGATLPMLVRRPGQLTRRYIEGERTRFVSPMGLFLFTVFIMFAVFQIAGIGPPADLAVPDELQTEVAAVRQEAQKDRDVLAADLAKLSADDPERSQMQNRLVQLDNTLKALAMAQAGVLAVSHRVPVLAAEERR